MHLMRGLPSGWTSPRPGAVNEHTFSKMFPDARGTATWPNVEGAWVLTAAAAGAFVTWNALFV